MKQKFLLKAMLLLCALVAGSSSVWADDVLYYTLDGTKTGSGSAYASANSITQNGMDWKVTGNTQQNPWRIGGKSTSNVDRPVYSETAMGSAISKVEFTFGSTISSKITINSVTLIVSTATNGSGTLIDEVTKTSGFAADATLTFTPTGEIKWSKDLYYKLTFNIKTDDTSSNYYLQFKSAKFYKEGNDSEPSITLASNTINATEAAVSTTSIEVTYNNLTNYDADVIFYEADGTTNASYDHSWLTAEINATTKNLDYSITANTGAARTAYLRVYAVGDEGDTESSLITITQAAKPVATPTFSPEGGSYMQGTGITLTSEGNTIYYNIKTDGSTPSDPTNASTEYTTPIVLGSGTTKIKAIAYDTYGNASSVVTRTYTGIALASLPFTWTGTSEAGKDELAAETGVVVSLGSNYAESNAPYRLKFDGVGKYVSIYFNEKPENVFFTAKLFNAASTGSKIKVQGSADGITFTDIEEFTIKGSANATFEFATSNAFAATHRVVKLVMSSKDQNVAVGTICVSCIPIAPAKQYTTLTSKYDLDFTGLSSLKAYIATEVSGGNVLMTQVNKVPANTGLVLKATTPGSAVNVPVFDGTGADDVSENKMAGSATATTAIEANAGYILKDGVFQPATAGTLAAGKAYLNIAVSAGAPTLNLDFDGEATSISEELRVKNEEFATAPVYNLAGQRVAQPTKGLYIVNGRKVVIK